MKKGFGRFGKICGIYSPIGSSTRLGAADWKRVCLTAQKSSKSEQIEQIDNDKKKYLEDLKRFV